MAQVPPPLPQSDEVQWWYSRAGTSQGPVSVQELVDKVALSALGPLELVWNQKLPGWTPVERVPELALHLPLPNLSAMQKKGSDPPPPEAEPADNLVAPPTSAPAPGPTPGLPRASTSQRVLARAYDFVYYVVLALLPMGFLVGLLEDTPLDLKSNGPLSGSPLLESIRITLGFVMWLFMAATFEGLSHFSDSRSSRGKEWMGLEVRNSKGDELSPAESFRRQLRLFVQGYGAGIPLALVISAPYQLYRATTGKATTYDDDDFFVAKVGPMDWSVAIAPLRWVTVIAIILFVAAVIRYW